MKVSCKPTCRHMDIDCKKNITFSVDESNMTVTQSSRRLFVCSKDTQGRERVWLLGRGSHPFPNQLGGLGKRYKLLSDPAAKMVFARSCLQRALQRAGGQVGGVFIWVGLWWLLRLSQWIRKTLPSTLSNLIRQSHSRRLATCDKKTSYSHMCLQCVHWRCLLRAALYAITALARSCVLDTAD